jgi:hypothetical protein
VHYEDLDRDGDQDAVTARFLLDRSSGGPPKFVTEFLWFENPGDGSYRGWTEHMITSGPDVHFHRYNLTSQGKVYDVFVCSEFFRETLTVYWTEENDWSSPNIQENVRIVRIFKNRFTHIKVYFLFRSRKS